MAVCASREKLLQEATGVRRVRVYPVAKNTTLYNLSAALCLT